MNYFKMLSTVLILTLNMSVTFLANAEATTVSDDAQIVWQPNDINMFDFSGDQLKEKWPLLHIEDRIPFPTASLLEARALKAPKIIETYGGSSPDYEAIASSLQDGFRFFHAGKLQDAYKVAKSLGHFGVYLAGQAQYVNAFFLTEDPQEKERLLTIVVDEISAAEGIEPDNRHLKFMHIYALGRAVEPKPFKIGMVGTYNLVNSYTKQLTKEDDQHLGAHLIRAAFLAQGAVKSPFLAGVRYGASEKKSKKYFEKTTSEHSGSIIGHYTYAENLKKLDVDRDIQRRELEKALAIEAWDVYGVLTQKLAKEALLAVKD